MSLSGKFDFVIIGGGMAGASLSAELAAHGSVLVLEQEDQPGYHATGRSVAFWAETYGGPLVQPLTTASRAMLAEPEPAFAEQGFLSARGALHIGTPDDAAARDAMVEDFAGSGVAFDPVDGAALHAWLPGLREEYSVGLAEPSTRDIDVAALHGAYLARLRRQGGQVVPRSAMVRAARRGAVWVVETTAGEVHTNILINAAGAWADRVAEASGIAPLGIVPLRRTVVQLRTEPGASNDLPIIMDLAQQFYFKPVGQGRIWLSPHDETPCAPCDAAPEDLDVAIAIDRFEQVVDWKVAGVERRWAGLRSFAPDRLPVYGFDPRAENFFWFAGQGGFGIQTAPAAALLGAALVTGGAPPAAVAGIDPSHYAPARFAI